MDKDVKSRDARLRMIGVVEKAGEVSEIRIFPEYCEGLTAIGDYEKIMIQFWMHLRNNDEDRSRLMSSRPRHSKEGKSGIFASHSSHRPNPIGVTIVELVSVEETRLVVKGFDAFEETPIIDIKSA